MVCIAIEDPDIWHLSIHHNNRKNRGILMSCTLLDLFDPIPICSETWSSHQMIRPPHRQTQTNQLYYYYYYHYISPITFPNLFLDFHTTITTATSTITTTTIITATILYLFLDFHTTVPLPSRFQIYFWIFILPPLLLLPRANEAYTNNNFFVLL